MINKYLLSSLVCILFYTAQAHPSSKLPQYNIINDLSSLIKNIANKDIQDDILSLTGQWGVKLDPDSIGEIILIIAHKIAFSQCESKSLKTISSFTTLENDITITPPSNDQHHDAIYKLDRILNNDQQNNWLMLQSGVVHQYSQFQ